MHRIFSVKNKQTNKHNNYSSHLFCSFILFEPQSSKRAKVCFARFTLGSMWKHLSFFWENYSKKSENSIVRRFSFSSGINCSLKDPKLSQCNKATPFFWIIWFDFRSGLWRTNNHFNCLKFIAAVISTGFPLLNGLITLTSVPAPCLWQPASTHSYGWPRCEMYTMYTNCHTAFISLTGLIKVIILRSIWVMSLPGT